MHEFGDNLANALTATFPGVPQLDDVFGENLPDLELKGILDIALQF